MSNISKHNAKQEGESNDGENCRVCLLEHGHTVGVDDLLKDTSELICLNIGGLSDCVIFKSANLGSAEIFQILS